MRPVGFVLLAFLFAVVATLSQPLQLTLQIQPNPSPYLSDWQTRKETAFLSVTNASTSTQLVRVDARVFKGAPSGNPIANTKTQQMPILQIDPGVVMFDAADIFPADAVQFQDGVDADATRTGRIPAGNYTLCVTLVNAENVMQPLSQQRCAGFNVQHVLPPQLLYPVNGTVVTTEQVRNLVFRWSRETPPVSGSSAEFVLTERYTNQTAWQALSANPPVYQQHVQEGLTQLQWPPDVMLPSDREYVWSVRVVHDGTLTEQEFVDPFTLRVENEDPKDPCTKNTSLSLECKNTNFLVGTPVTLIPIFNGGTECIRAVNWKAVFVGEQTETEVLTSSITDPTTPEAFAESFTFTPDQPGRYVITCSASTVNAVSRTTETRVNASYTVDVKGSGQLQTSTPCRLSILYPELPCTGTMHEYHTDGSIEVRYLVAGSFTTLNIEIYENPCGTYDPPYKPENPETPTTTSRPITQGYKKTATLPCPTTPGPSSLRVPISDLIKPGGAYIVGLTGTCVETNQDGSTSTSFVQATESCWRYRPLTTAAVITEHERDGSATDTRETKPRDGPQTNEPPVPTPEIPCDSIPPTITNCGPTQATDPATPIYATLELKDAATYPYPRATPLRVNAIDYDYAIFQCTGCYGGMAEKKIPVRDDIGDISWKLYGKGSLNKPFDASRIQSIDADIAALIKRLAEIIDSIALTTKEKADALDNLHAAQKDAAKAIEGQKTLLKGAKDSLSKVTAELVGLRGRLDSLATTLDSLASRYAVLSDTIIMHQDSIARLDSLLTSPPTAEEVALLSKVDASMKALALAESELRDLQITIASTTASLQKAIRDADKALSAAQLMYSNAQNAAGKGTRKIADLQASLYGTAALRDYQQSRRDVQRSVSVFTAAYSAASHVVPITSLVSTMLDDVHLALESTPAGPRATAAKHLDSTKSLVVGLLSSACSSIADSSTRFSCLDFVVDFVATLDRYSVDAKYCLLHGEILKKGLDLKIKAAQADLSSKESGLEAAASAVVAAQTAHAAALDTYTSTIRTLDDKRAAVVTDIDAKRAEHTQAQREYQTVKDSRDSAFEVQQPILLAGRSEFARARDSARREVDSLALRAQVSRSDSIDVLVQVTQLAADSTRQADSIASIEKEIARLNAIIDTKDEKIAKPFDDRLARLRADSADIEDKLKKLRTDRESAAGGSKSAAGEFAYYIPPPLEEIMTESSKKRFDELKDSIAVAEGNLAAALAKKESLQGTLARIIEDIANGLAEIKQLEYQKDEAAAKLKEVDGDLADLKNDLAKGFREEYDGLTDEITQAGKDATSADAAYVQAVADASSKTKIADAKKAELDAARMGLLPKQVLLSDAIDEYKKKKSTLNDRAVDIAKEQNTLNSHRKELRSANRESKRADDRTRRAIARENTAAETAGRASQSAAKSKVKSTETLITTNKSIIEALGASYATDLTAMLAEDKKVSDAFDEWLKVYNKMTLKKSDYTDAVLQLQVARQQMEHYRGLRDRAEARQELATTKQEEIDHPDSSVNNSGDVAAKQEEREALQSQVDEATKRIDEIKSDITDAVSSKDKLIDDARKGVDDARDKLDEANANLKSFIKAEFEKPIHIDTIEITVHDKVVDGWRSRDKEKVFICHIRYDGKRVPELLCDPFAPVAPSVVTTDGPCVPVVSTDIGAAITSSAPVLDRLEPRTIALLYKNGKPLWKEWPVIEEPKLLSKDVVVVNGVAGDADMFIHACAPQVPKCVPPAPLKSPVVDLASREWSGDGTFRHILDRSPRVLWEPMEVTPGVCKKKQLTKAEYRAEEIHGDVKVSTRTLHEVHPGVLVEVTDSLVGWPDHTDTVVARIVMGNHKGLAGEEIVCIPKLEVGSSEEWSLDGKQTSAIKHTDADGYVKFPFKFGKGFAKWSIMVRWVRGDTCERRTLPIISPLNLKFHSFKKNAPTLAWDNAVKIWEGADVNATVDAMTEVTEDNNPYGKMVHGIAGFLDENKEFVNDQTMHFKPVKPKFTIDPEEAPTTVIGIARTQVMDTIEKKLISLKVFPDDSLKPITRPQEIEKSYNPRGGKRFKIGDPSSPFYVEMEQSFDLQETVSGKGKLKVDMPNQFMKSLVDLPVDVSDVTLDADTVATAGDVAYSSSGLTVSWDAFTFTLSTIRIRAGIGCGIEGTLAHSSLESPIQFAAELGGDGEFLGTASNLPSVKAGGFTLRQGASITIDFHRKLPADSPLGADFKGIVVGQAELEFPEEFRTKNSNTPTVLAVKDLGIGNSGLSGSVSVEGGPLAWSFSKFSISVSKVSLTFKENALTAGSIEGAFSLEKPLSGTLQTKITFSDSWTAEFETKSSISIPRWKAVVAIQPGTKLEYNKQTGVGTFTLVAVIQSDQLGRVQIDELTLGSDGTFKVEGGVKKDVTIKVLKGFDLKITEVTISATADDYTLAIRGSFGIPGIGLDQLVGTLTVTPGPEFNVKFDGGKVSIVQGPFTLEGNFEWQKNAFYADLSVEITNVLKGINGVIFVGTQPKADGNSYTFWYVGLTVSTAIPLGQSGLSITSLGGGVGWNCRPPIGNERPTPEYFDNIALRASVGIGNTLPPPQGKVFNSEFVMVYAPGSITLGGSAWLMDQRKSIQGDGQLTIAWSPESSVSGFLRMNIGIPESGKVFSMRGKVDFLFSSAVFKIESEYLDASLLEVVNANAQFRVTPSSGFIKGKMWYDINESADIGVGTVSAGISMKATGELTYATSPSLSLTGSLRFSGNAYLSFENSLTSFDLARAKVDCSAGFSTVGSKFRMDASVSAYVSVLGFGGNVDFDLGAEV